MKRLVIAAAMIAALALPAKALPMETFLDECHAGHVGCIAYANGVVDTYLAIEMSAMTPEQLKQNRPVEVAKICMPPNTTMNVKQMVADGESFVLKYPQALKMDAATIMLAGLRQRYSCQ